MFTTSLLDGLITKSSKIMHVQKGVAQWGAAVLLTYGNAETFSFSFCTI